MSTCVMGPGQDVRHPKGLEESLWLRPCPGGTQTQGHQNECSTHMRFQGRVGRPGHSGGKGTEPPS